MTEIVVLGTSDIHGFYSATNEGVGGLNCLASVFENEKKPILIDNGDYLVGSPEATFYNATLDVSPLMTIANQLGIDVMVPGNHEFDYGIEFLKKQAEAFKGAYLCANLVDNQDQLLFEPYTIIERYGVKVGVIGVVTSYMSQLTNYEKIKSVKFLDVVSTVKKWLPKVKEYADIIIVSYHGGIERDMKTGNPTQYDTGEDQTYRLIQEIPEIDGVICGHQHRVNQGKLNETVFVQPGYRGHYVGKLTFTVDAEGVQQRTSALINTTVNFAKQELFVDNQDYQAWLQQPIALDNFEAYLSETFGQTIHCIELNGKTNEQFRTSFKAPYMVSLYHLSYDETLEMLNKGTLSGLAIVQGELQPKQASYRILTNSTQFPSYRLEKTYVNNIWDEYRAFLRLKSELS
ncbi:2',3'-cyclic-nucleotide 2'-phosphodiesterase/3'-nucleotidase [Enterococcus sp. AZ194]|uniref:bifunctional metallophosphatase/5'-nucleotidase n=1 Tax=Enterococcus sp. AZ194 TaxID=2774629 RepID=UPI003F26561A